MCMSVSVSVSVSVCVCWGGGGGSHFLNLDKEGGHEKIALKWWG